MMQTSFNYRESFEDFEGLTNSESFGGLDDSFENIDLADNDLEGFDAERVSELAERINQDVAKLSEAEMEAYLHDTFTEAFPLIPLIAALAPVVIQGVSSLISGASNRPATPPRPPVPPQPVTHPPRPTVQLQPRPMPVRQPTPTGNPVSSAASLISLLQNPAVIQAITGLVQSAGATSGGSRPASPAPNATAPIVDLLLGTLSQLASNTRSEVFGESATDYPDFLFDSDGNLTADPFAPDQMANLLTQQLTLYP